MPATRSLRCLDLSRVVEMTVLLTRRSGGANARQSGPPVPTRWDRLTLAGGDGSAHREETPLGRGHEGQRRHCPEWAAQTPPTGAGSVDNVVHGAPGADTPGVARPWSGAQAAGACRHPTRMAHLHLCAGGPPYVYRVALQDVERTGPVNPRTPAPCPVHQDVPQPAPRPKGGLRARRWEQRGLGRRRSGRLSRPGVCPGDLVIAARRSGRPLARRGSRGAGRLPRRGVRSCAVLVVARVHAMERKRVRPRAWRHPPVGPLRVGGTT